GWVPSAPPAGGPPPRAGSQPPPRGLASTDAAPCAPPPLMRSVRQPDGSERRVPVPLEEYRALRWNLGTLAAGQSAQVQARVRVNTVQPPAASPPAPAKP